MSLFAQNTTENPPSNFSNLPKFVSCKQNLTYKMEPISKTSNGYLAILRPTIKPKNLLALVSENGLEVKSVEYDDQASDVPLMNLEKLDGQNEDDHSHDVKHECCHETGQPFHNRELKIEIESESQNQCSQLPPSQNFEDQRILQLMKQEKLEDNKLDSINTPSLKMPVNQESLPSFLEQPPTPKKLNLPSLSPETMQSSSNSSSLEIQDFETTETTETENMNLLSGLGLPSLEDPSHHDHSIPMDPNRAKKFICEYCGDSFFRKDEKKRHIRCKHTNEKKFTCQFCGKSFARSDHCETHKLIHLPKNERPYKCNICDKRFCRRDEMKRHFKTKHPKLYENPILCWQKYIEKVHINFDDFVIGDQHRKIATKKERSVPQPINNINNNNNKTAIFPSFQRSQSMSQMSGMNFDLSNRMKNLAANSRKRPHETVSWNVPTSNPHLAQLPKFPINFSHKGSPKTSTTSGTESNFQQLPHILPNQTSQLSLNLNLINTSNLSVKQFSEYMQTRKEAIEMMVKAKTNEKFNNRSMLPCTRNSVANVPSVMNFSNSSGHTPIKIASEKDLEMEDIEVEF